MAELARAQAAGLDALGVGHGERVAVVSHNSARLLTSFFGVSAYGRVLVPVNFRLGPDEVAYIVEHSGASVLLVDPELDESLKDVTAKHRFVLGADTDEDALRQPRTSPSRGRPTRTPPATINYTSGTTARPKGVQLTHRTLWLNAATFGWHMGVNDRDVYLHTLPMFHCNGWGMVYAVTAMGGKHIVLRAVDGNEILDRIDRHGVSLMCGAPTVGSMVLDAAKARSGRRPRCRARCDGSWPALRRRPRPSRPSSATSTGSSCRSTASPRPHRCSPSTGVGPSTTTSRPTSGPGS